MTPMRFITNFMNALLASHCTGLGIPRSRPVSGIAPWVASYAGDRAAGTSQAPVRLRGIEHCAELPGRVPHSSGQRFRAVPAIVGQRDRIRLYHFPNHRVRIVCAAHRIDNSTVRCQPAFQELSQKTMAEQLIAKVISYPSGLYVTAPSCLPPALQRSAGNVST